MSKGELASMRAAAPVLERQREKQLTELRKLSEKATLGEWKWLPNEGQFIVSDMFTTIAEVPCQGCNANDGAFIVACVNYVRALTREPRLQGEGK